MALDRREPLALFLGQDAWSDDGADRVLSHALEKIGRSDGAERGWAELLKTPGETLADTFYTWLTEQFARRARPQWLDLVSKLPWSVIGTTSLDPSLRQDMRVGSRDPAVVLSGTEKPVTARSLARPPLYCFYGLASESDAQGRPPQKRTELNVRQTMHVASMLAHFVESITPLGLLVVDGYRTKRDWLSSQQLLSLVGALPKGNVIWCGTNATELDDPDLQDLLIEREALCVEDRLAVLLKYLEDSGVSLDDLAEAIPQPNAISLSGAKRSAFVPSVELRTRVEAVAAIVDDAWLQFLPPLEPNELYAEFRRFHGGLATPPEFFAGIRKNFAIARDYEPDLSKLVNKAIAEHSAYGPIVLFGQSGTGKSVALTRVAIEARETARAAVLIARSRLPLEVEIDDFCALAEDHGASATLIICDLNIAPERYRDLLLGLRTRGRRVVIAGSSYGDPTKSRLKQTVSALPNLSQAEIQKIDALLNSFGLEGFSEGAQDDPYLLAQFYRTLPPSRPQLIAGLSREARDAEGRFRALLRNTELEQVPQSELARKLLEAGLVASSVSLVGESDDLLDNVSDAAARTIDLVMVAGQVGCAIPINLLMRAVAEERSVDFGTFGKLFEKLDVVRILEQGESGEDYSASPRLRIEAELLCRARLGDAVAQGKLIVSLLRAARLGWDAGGNEHRFVVDLVQRTGPDGPKGTWFKNAYIDIAEALESIRSTSAAVDAALALQESVLRRNAVRLEVIGEHDAEALLMAAEEAVSAALADLERFGSRRQQMKNNLLVERAAVYGFLANQRSLKGESAKRIWETYVAGRASANAASGLTGRYRPVDVRLWTAERLLRDANLDDHEVAELRADIFEAIDEVESGATLDLDESDRFNQRKLQAGDTIGDDTLSEAAFAKLEQIGSAAGYFLRARKMAPSRHDVELNIESARTRALETTTFIRDHWDRVKNDSRVLRLLFEVQWIASTGAYPFAKNRGPLPWHNSERHDLLLLAREINSLTDYNINLYRYIEATLSWCLDLDKEAGELWIDLSRASEYVDLRRTRRLHVLTGESGQPQHFYGRIVEIVDDKTALLHVEDLKKKVRIRGVDFPHIDLEYGRSVSEFGISFNYIGPTADPLR